MNGSSRELVYIPIVHSQADLGALAEHVRRIKRAHLGRQVWAQNVADIEHLWEDIRRQVEAWDLPYPRVRVYQDGLPICGHELEIVADLSKAGSANHQLLLQLVEKGARLMGTESPELLLEEYGLLKRALQATSPDEARRVEEQQHDLGRELLWRRNAFIARRINETLCPRETGILFLGALHSLEAYLSGDIRVSYPFGRPLLSARAEEPRSGSGR